MPTLLSHPFPPEVKAFSTSRHAPYVFDKEGSPESYAEFNLTHYCGDAPERVTKAKEWLAEQLGISSEQIILPHQTHTDHTLCIDQDFLRADEETQREMLEEVDALLTNLPGICIGVSTADCVPIILYDPRQKVTAAIHAGWRGTVKRIVTRCLEEMTSRFGTTPADVLAAIGPCISAEAYEVGEEVIEKFREAGFPLKKIVTRNIETETLKVGTKGTSEYREQQEEYAKPHLNLPLTNRLLLEEAGVPSGKIADCGICTYLHDQDFFSARRLGIHSGRIFSGIIRYDK
ncbi:MAG: peptidoglycan editing factor PgeF [Alloprevotella sp.]